MQVETLELQSEKNRKRLVEIVYKAKAGHIGGDLIYRLFRRLLLI